MRESDVSIRCDNLKIQLDNDPELQRIIDEGLQFVYGKCANCNIRFYHQMKCADDLLINFGRKYDTRGMKILNLLELMFKDCEEVRKKGYCGTMKLYRLPETEVQE